MAAPFQSGDDYQGFAGEPSTPTSADLSAVSAQAASAINVVSNALSNLQSVHDVLSNRVSANSGGAVSVTSNELSTVSAQAASAINVVSNALSALTSVVGAIPVASVTSNEVSVVSAAAADAISIANAASVAAANALSVGNAASNAASVVSNALSTETVNRVSADNALSNAISALSAAVAPQYFYPTALSVDVGVLAAGSVGDLSALGGGSVMVCEIISTPGFLATLQFSAVSAVPNRLVVHAEYEGGAGHTVDVDIFNHVTSVWDTLGYIPDTAGGQTFEFDLGEATAYLSLTNSRIRFNHVSAGLAGHELMLDYVVIGRFPLGAGITDHGALQGLSDDDHTQYALADGSRGFTATNSAIDTLSGQVSVISQQVSVLSQQVSALSQSLSLRAYQTSLNTVSNNLSNEISNRVSADNVLCNAISNLQSAHDVLSNRVSANSGVGGGASVTSLVFNNHSNSNSVEFAAIYSALSSVESQIQSAINTLSAGPISEMLQGISVLSQQVSVLSAWKSVASNTLCNLVSLVDEHSAAIIELYSVDGTRSEQVSALSQAVSVLSQSVSVLSVAVAGAGTPMVKYLTSPNAAITTNVLSDVSLLAMTVAASTIYEMNGVLIYSAATGAASIGFGLSFPALLGGGGRIQAGIDPIQEPNASTISGYRTGLWNLSFSNSVAVSVTRGATTGQLPVIYEGVFYVGAAGGTVRPKARTSSGQNLVIEAGSYLKFVRIGP